MNLDPTPNVFGLTDEEAALIVAYVAAQLTGPLTETLKRWRKASGVTTQRISWAVAFAWVILGNWILNPQFFGGDLRSAVYAVLGAGFAVWRARAQWQMLKGSTGSAIQEQEPIQVTPVAGGASGKN